MSDYILTDQDKETLRLHRMWYAGETGGARLDWSRRAMDGAYLSGAYLRGAYLRGAYLRGAYLRGADLRGADLSGADLSGADLSGAYLRGAYLRGAYLRGADLSGAIVPLSVYKAVHAHKTTKEQLEAWHACTDGMETVAKHLRKPWTVAKIYSFNEGYGEWIIPKVLDMLLSYGKVNLKDESCPLVRIDTGEAVVPPAEPQAAQEEAPANA